MPLLHRAPQGLLEGAGLGGRRLHLDQRGTAHLTIEPLARGLLDGDPSQPEQPDGEPAVREALVAGDLTQPCDG